MPLNVTKSLVKLTCSKCPVMDESSCYYVLGKLDDVYNRCNNSSLSDCQETCYEFNLCE